MSLIGLLSSGRVAAMINYTAGPANVTAAIRTAVDPHRRLVARLHREGRARRHRRGGRERPARNSSGWRTCAPASRSWRSWSPSLLWRWPLASAGAPTSRRSSCSPRARKARRRRWCSPTATCSPTPGRSRRARAVARGQAAQRAAGVPFLRADRRHDPAAAGRRAVLPLPLAAALQADPARRRRKIKPTIMFAHRHLPHRLCAHRRRRRFRQPAARGRRRRSACAPRRGASGASVSAPRSSRASA